MSSLNLTGVPPFNFTSLSSPIAVPLGIPLSEWEAAVAHPNATGQSSIFGPDFSSNYGLSNTWTINITVKAGISLGDTRFPALYNRSQFVDGTQVILNPPDNSTVNKSLPVPAGTTFTGCLITGGNPGFTSSAESAGQSNTGSCSFVPSDCVSDFTNNVASAISFANGNCTVEDVDVPQSCGGTFGWGGIWAIEINSSTVDNGGPIVAWGDAPHDLSNLQPYDIAVENIWAGVMTWVANMPNGTANGTASVNKQPIGTNFICARAGDIVAGSHTPGSGAGALMLPAMTMLAALAATVLLLL